MIPVKHAQIPIQAINQALDPATRKVLDLLEHYHVPTRIVGGAVRDLLLGQTPRDIDLVADADPSTLIYIFETHNIPVDTSGIVHGTVKAIFGHGSEEQKVDVSSLGYRIINHDHQLSVHSTHNWALDSQLRDITINSMSMTRQGLVYDYQNALEHLHNQKIQLCAHAQDSLSHDANGVMRYFRALSLFAHPQVRKKDLILIAKNVPSLQNYVDDSRVQMNFLTILRSKNRQHVLKVMCDMNVPQYLPFVKCK